MGLKIICARYECNIISLIFTCETVVILQTILEEHQTEIEDSNKSPKVQVIAASGDNIIAVANPALAMSPAILPLALEAREHVKMVDQ